MPDVVIPAPSGFVDAAVPARKSFKKAKDIIKAAIVAQNPDAAHLDFTDFKVAVDKDQRHLTLTLKDELKNNYNIGGEKTGNIVFDYADIDFNTIMTTVLGFSAQYTEGKKDAVIAALPAGLSHSYEETTQILTVTVDNQITAVDWSAENEVLGTVLFAGKTFQIAFFDHEIDVALKLPNRSLTMAVADFVQA